MFKPGDKVVYIDNKLKKFQNNYFLIVALNSIDLYKVYTVFIYDKFESINYIQVEEKPRSRYMSDRFISLKEYRKRKLLKINNN
jgi:hypothetical protein